MMLVMVVVLIMMMVMMVMLGSGEDLGGLLSERGVNDGDFIVFHHGVDEIKHGAIRRTVIRRHD